jgi:hypothetical protein
MADTPSSTTTKDTTKDAPAPATADNPAEEFAKSAQAQFSTYYEHPDLPDENPPLGRHVVQERGQPTEGDTPPVKGIAD